MVKYAKKISHTNNHNHIYGINMKKPIQTSLIFIIKQLCTPLTLWLVAHKV
jgi:hypothetical protein